MKMKNGHADPEPSTIWQYLAERGDEPHSSETLALDADRLKVEALISAGLLDSFPPDERIRIGWNIIRQTDETRN